MHSAIRNFIRKVSMLKQVYLVSGGTMKLEFGGDLRRNGILLSR
jgi:hypothetical protein